MVYRTEGFSVEFATLNPQGFFFYSLYMVAGYIDPKIGAGSVRKAHILSILTINHVFLGGDK